MVQFLAQVISRDFAGKELSATYKTIDTFDFQDAVGELLLRLCQVCNRCFWFCSPDETVPFGVLVFLSSYSLLDKLEKRWKETQLWNRISAYKVIVTESRGRNKVCGW